MNDDKWTLITPEIFLKALGETLQMLGVALALGSVLGIAIGTLPSGRHTYTATFVPSDTANVSPSTSAPVKTR